MIMATVVAKYHETRDAVGLEIVTPYSHHIENKQKLAILEGNTKMPSSPTSVEFEIVWRLGLDVKNQTHTEQTTWAK